MVVEGRREALNREGKKNVCMNYGKTFEALGDESNKSVEWHSFTSTGQIKQYIFVAK